MNTEPHAIVTRHRVDVRRSTRSPRSVVVATIVALVASLFALTGTAASADEAPEVTFTTMAQGSGIVGPYGITVGPDGNLWFTNYRSIGRITPDGT